MTTWYKIADPAKQIEKFWEEVSESWKDLISLCGSYHPYYQKKHDLPITAQGAERECEIARTLIKLGTLDDPTEQMELAKRNKDVNSLQTLCNQIWFGMPESSEVRYGILEITKDK